MFEHLSRDARAAATRDVLVERFPHCFKGKRQMKVPLALGINAAILERCPDLSAADVQAALGDYCWGSTYLSHLCAGAQRIDLDGQPTGQIVTVAHAEVAGAKLMDMGKAELAAGVARSIRESAIAA